MADAAADPDLGPDPTGSPNTRRRVSANDTLTSSNSSPRQHLPTDANTSSDVENCRICRGEGSPDEPLFYPCKCSGSIKYVHQNCLMEWLSHSQKKHCELCKTPFRFTKLYAANMPPSLPFHTFLGHVAKYLLRNALVWLRAALVMSVWLVGLPWFMRSIWTFLFWISDEGLGRHASLFGPPRGRMLNELDLNSVPDFPGASGICPSSPLFPITTCWALASITDNPSLDSVPRLIKGLHAINLTQPDRPYAAFLRLIFGGVVEKDNTGLHATSPAGVGNMPSGTPTPPSLLSEVGFLRNLTRHPPFNRFLIATLEGQIITILVVVCFILIILVRDYVVQQQPEINMRAAFAAGEDEQPPQPPENHLRNVPDGAVDNVPLPESQNGNDLEDPRLGSPWDSGAVGPSQSANAGDSSTGFYQGDESDLHQFIRIHREAGGDPERIEELVKEQHLEHKLEWWMRMNRKRRDGSSLDGNVAPSPRLASENSESSEEYRIGAGAELTEADRTDTGEGLVVQGPESGTSADKGKAKAEDDDLESSFLLTPASRPRANTDGPIVNTTMNPLANNSWSFANLPAEASSRQPEDETHSSEQDAADSHAGSRRMYLVRPLNGSAVEAAALPGQDLSPTTLNTASDEPVLDVEAETTQPDIPEFNFNTQPELDMAVPPRQQPAGLVGRIADFMWRDVEAIDPAELVQAQVVEDPHEIEVDPFLDVPPDVEMQIDDERDQEVVEAAVAAGLDPDAIEDAEDLEGILELLGMRGPIAGLFQNAIFCAFLVGVTIFFGIFVPYNIGRITVWTLANPMRLVRMLFSISKFLQDVVLICLGSTVAAVSYVFVRTWTLLRQGSLPAFADAAANSSWNMTRNAASRVTQSFMTEMPIISANEMRNFSALSHEALLTVKAYVSVAFSAVAHVLTFTSRDDRPINIAQGFSTMSCIGATAWNGFKELPQILAEPSSWVINLSLPESAQSVNPLLAYWDGMDRFWAILCGYVAFSVAAALYLRRGVPFSSGPTGQDLETSVLDGLRQASGVVKVILIIGIEMLVFPLYCGLLLDVALLPLFEDATVKSRLMFTLNYPLTSMFVHWFVGTGYMFHFALFVSMCRKIMRRGVLYFIRDPDDPEFHPVRDVLERNVTTQLRKILFSAFVYGALVIICLGGVVWGLSYSIPDVLPIHYSSNEPVLEFPIDLLFYNFLMPLAVRFFKPSDGLHIMYTWWFRKCAKALRLTWFLFGERRLDEEGVLLLEHDSPHHKLPWWKKIFLEIHYSTGEVVPKTWKSTFEDARMKRSSGMDPDDMLLINVMKKHLVQSGQIVPNGRFVRTPASDQVKIPKGMPVFMEVTESNRRRDGKPDSAETDIYSTNQYQLVYIPPFFRVRVFLFILFIWIFAAFTGVGFTIVPLVFGRRVFKLLIPAHIRTNDIYAFSIGIYILGSVAYGAFHARSIFLKTKSWVTAAINSVTDRGVARRAISIAYKAAKLLYAYFFLLVVFPMMVTSLMELYFLIPLNTWMYSAVFSSPTVPGPGQAVAASVVNINPRHTVRVIQSWTLGLLYLKLGARVVTTWYEDTRLSAAVRAVLRRGWLDPDVAVLTRAFVVPGLVVWFAMVSAPLLVGRMLVAYGAVEDIVAAVADVLGSRQDMGNINLDAGFGDGAGSLVVTGLPDRQLVDAVVVLIYRLSFPLTALAVATAAAGWNLVKVFQSWKIRIRDEAYLIGERLHNYGVANGHARARGSLRAGGPRL